MAWSDDLVVEPLPPDRYGLVASALATADINKWMANEWREHDVTERTIAASIASKRNRMWLVSVGHAPYGVVALGSMNAGDQTASLWYLRLPQVPRREGVMTAALQTVARRAFDELGLNSLSASVHADNFASRRMLERAGFALAGVLRQGFRRDGLFVDRVTYDLLRDEAGIE